MAANVPTPRAVAVYGNSFLHKLERSYENKTNNNTKRAIARDVCWQ